MRGLPVPSSRRRRAGRMDGRTICAARLEVGRRCSNISTSTIPLPITVHPSFSPPLLVLACLPHRLPVVLARRVAPASRLLLLLLFSFPPLPPPLLYLQKVISYNGRTYPPETTSSSSTTRARTPLPHHLVHRNQQKLGTSVVLRRCRGAAPSRGNSNRRDLLSCAQTKPTPLRIPSRAREPPTTSSYPRLANKFHRASSVLTLATFRPRLVSPATAVSTSSPTRSRTVRLREYTVQWQVDVARCRGRLKPPLLFFFFLPPR